MSQKKKGRVIWLIWEYEHMNIFLVDLRVLKKKNTQKFKKLYIYAQCLMIDLGLDIWS